MANKDALSRFPPRRDYILTAENCLPFPGTKLYFIKIGSICSGLLHDSAAVRSRTRLSTDFAISTPLLFIRKVSRYYLLLMLMFYTYDVSLDQK